MADGHLNKCKECQKAASRATYAAKKEDPVWADRQRERHRDKYHRLNHQWHTDPMAKRKARARYSRRYPYKVLAAAAAAEVEVEDGCQRHHWSYQEQDWTDVIPLEAERHKKLHRFLSFDLESRRFRSGPHGVLLGTKAEHVRFAESVIGPIS